MIRSPRIVLLLERLLAHQPCAAQRLDADAGGHPVGRATARQPEQPGAAAERRQQTGRLRRAKSLHDRISQGKQVLPGRMGSDLRYRPVVVFLQRQPPCAQLPTERHYLGGKEPGAVQSGKRLIVQKRVRSDIELFKEVIGDLVVAFAQDRTGGACHRIAV